MTNLELRLTSSQPTRLNVSKQQDIVLSAGQSTSLKFLAQAKGNGPVQMTAQLYTTGPDAQRYGPEVTFTVEVSQVTSGVWWVVGAAARWCCSPDCGSSCSAASAVASPTRTRTHR